MTGAPVRPEIVTTCHIRNPSRSYLSIIIGEPSSSATKELVHIARSGTTPTLTLPGLLLTATAALLMSGCGGGTSAPHSGAPTPAPLSNTVTPPVTTPVAPPVVDAAPPATVETTNVTQGTLSGRRRDQVASYLGIPYAAPPVGDLRWRPPAAPASWNGQRSADTFANECQQVLPNGAFRAWTAEYLITGPASEDCLYLNLWTPARAANERLPVLVWFYGGAFQQGGTTVPVYNGAPLANKGMIVVTVNYRLNIFGFMAHPGLTAESPAGASGNYGLLDQVAALRWVQQNITSFGGDPARVTIAGQSAGAASVHFLIGSPLASGLFHQAIAQSGTDPAMWLPSRADGEATGLQLMRASFTKDIAAMRALTPAQLVEAATRGSVGFGAVVDGLLLPDVRHVSATTNDTSMLTGITADEASSIIPDYGVATPSSLRAQLDRDYGSLVNEFAALYPATDNVEAGLARAALARDNGLAALDLWARQRASQSKKPVYLYLFNHTEPGPNTALYRVFHSSDIPYAFGTLDAARPRPFTAQDRAVSETMSTYWANYVKTGNPNGGTLPIWPMHAAAAPQIMELAEPARARPLLDAAKLSLFERYIRAGGVLRIF